MTMPTPRELCDTTRESCDHCLDAHENKIDALESEIMALKDRRDELMTDLDAKNVELQGMWDRFKALENKHAELIETTARRTDQAHG